MFLKGLVYLTRENICYTSILGQLMMVQSICDSVRLRKKLFKYVNGWLGETNQIYDQTNEKSKNWWRKQKEM
jgi:hypothetical protein